MSLDASLDLPFHCAGRSGDGEVWQEKGCKNEPPTHNRLIIDGFNLHFLGAFWWICGRDKFVFW